MDPKNVSPVNGINTTWALSDLGIKIQGGKTIFRLPQAVHESIASLAREQKGMTKKKALGLIAKSAEKAAKEGFFIKLPIQEDAVRKSYAIAEDARQTLEEVAKKMSVSRDQALVAGWMYLKTTYEKKMLTTKEKIGYAETLLNGVEAAREILESPEMQAARNALAASDDSDYGTTGDWESACGRWAPILSLNEQPRKLYEFIEAKKAELAKENSGNNSDV